VRALFVRYLATGKGMVAYNTKASGLMQNDPQKMTWTEGKAVNSYSGLNSSFVNVALRILPIDSPSPTHVALGWKQLNPPASECRGPMTFSVFPLTKNKTA
jgi:hypothetical protein